MMLKLQNQLQWLRYNSHCRHHPIIIKLEKSSNGFWYVKIRNRLTANRTNNEDFPTPEFPISKSLNK